jgi:membrane protease subunit HflK
MKKKQTMFADVLETVTKYFLIVVAVVVLFILLSGIRIVESGNVALVMRFGGLVGDNYEEQVHEPGLLFAFPYFIDEVITVPTGSVIEQSVVTHYTPDGQELNSSQGGYLITGDQNVLVVSASVKYMVSDPVAYVTHVGDISTLINATVSTAMVNEAAHMDVDGLLTDGKDEFSVAVMDFAIEKLQRMGTGVTITSIELTQVAAPEAVRDSFDAVNAASTQAETLVQRATSYEEAVLPDARAKANAIVTAAKTAQSQATSSANTALVEFWGSYESLKAQRLAIYAENAQAHSHSADGTETCTQCEGEYEILAHAEYRRLYKKKCTAAIAKIGKLTLVNDRDSQIIVRE